jgi:GC-rich sequence DNA-binding factor
MKERSELIDKRRSEDDSDDLAMFLGVAPAGEEEKEEVDEMGRSRQIDSGPSSGIRRARRNARESRQVKRRKRNEIVVKPEDDGFSTDSTLAEGDATDYAASIQHLDRRVIALLEDVRAEDFRDPNKGIAVRFGAWRKMEEEEYVNAFGGLAMVHAWEFWARGEMVGWEPFRVSRLSSHELRTVADIHSPHRLWRRSPGSHRFTRTAIPIHLHSPVTV